MGNGLKDALKRPVNMLVTICFGSLVMTSCEDQMVWLIKRFPKFSKEVSKQYVNGHRVHFLHLRNTKREGDAFPCSFYESAHLDGDTDMVAYISAILKEEERRKSQGRADWQIPMRPDHGHRIGDDFGRPNQPGYPYIGRLRGLAELRGIVKALEFQSQFDGC